jgi:hypothetical protein
MGAIHAKPVHSVPLTGIMGKHGKWSAARPSVLLWPVPTVILMMSTGSVLSSIEKIVVALPTCSGREVAALYVILRLPVLDVIIASILESLTVESGPVLVAYLNVIFGMIGVMRRQK